MCIKTMPNSKNTSLTSLTPHQANTNATNIPTNHHHHNSNSVLGQKRRRNHNVRFELDESDDTTRQGGGINKRTRVVEFLPLSSEYSPAEKQIRWVSSQEKEATSRLASLQAKECRLQDAKREQDAAAAAAVLRLENDKDAQQQHCLCPSYRETYTNVFSACYQNMKLGQHQHLHQKQQQQTAENVIIPPQALALLAVQDSIRGLEDRTVPLTALLRRKIRRMVIRQIVLSHQKQQQQKQQQNSNDNANNNNNHKHLGHLSRSLTQPAAQFAHALGLADAASAMMEYNKINNGKTFSFVSTLNSQART